MVALSFESFVRKIFIKAPLNKLYWCWATPEGICSWFLQEAVYRTEDGRIRQPGEYLEAGDRYTWRWFNWDGEESGKILEIDGKNHLAFSFADFCQVRVTLEEDGDDVLLTLEQSNIPTDEDSKMNLHVGCSNGWTFWLANLKAYLEHGILLHETRKDLRDIPLSSFQFVNM
jgi:uncharacterized protein YndB with AHSA1/START domain